MDLRKCPKCEREEVLRWLPFSGHWRCQRSGCGYSAPREILPGSCWRRKEGGGLWTVRGLYSANEVDIGQVQLNRLVIRREDWDLTEFRKAFIWEADPGPVV